MTKLWIEYVEWDITHTRYKAAVKSVYYTLDGSKLIKDSFVTMNGWNGAFVSPELQNDAPETLNAFLEACVKDVVNEHMKNLMKELKTKVIVPCEFVKKLYPDAVGTTIVLRKNGTGWKKI